MCSLVAWLDCPINPSLLDLYVVVHIAECKPIILSPRPLPPWPEFRGCPPPVSFPHNREHKCPLLLFGNVTSCVQKLQADLDLTQQIRKEMQKSDRIENEKPQTRKAKTDIIAIFLSPIDKANFANGNQSLFFPLPCYRLPTPSYPPVMGKKVIYFLLASLLFFVALLPLFAANALILWLNIITVAPLSSLLLLPTCFSFVRGVLLGSSRRGLIRNRSISEEVDANAIFIRRGGRNRSLTTIGCDSPKVFL